MTDPALPPDPDDEAQLQVPGEVVENSNLADRRPDVNRLRAVRTGEGTATLCVGWPENSDTLALPTRISEQARAFAQATEREDRLLETPAVAVEVIAFGPGPELEEPPVAVPMDLVGSSAGADRDALRRLGDGRGDSRLVHRRGGRQCLSRETPL